MAQSDHWDIQSADCDGDSEEDQAGDDGLYIVEELNASLT